MTGFFPEQMDGENRYITGEVFSTVIRELKRSEIRKIWEIDRSEVIDRVYHFRDDNLVLETVLTVEVLFSAISKTKNWSALPYSITG